MGCADRLGVGEADEAKKVPSLLGHVRCGSLRRPLTAADKVGLAHYLFSVHLCPGSLSRQNGDISFNVCLPRENHGAERDHVYLRATCLIDP